MPNSSIKKLWPTSLMLACGLAYAAPSLKLEPRLELTSRLAYHLVTPRDLASHRHTLELEQKAKWGDWTAVGSVQAFAEVAYITNSRYDTNTTKKDAGEVFPNDVYLQYKSPSWIVRLGNQQVVWGEAYGFYYADIVNPKDTRDFGLGDLSKQRVAVPMANVKYIFPHASVQVVFIPKPYFNKIPALGTDFGSSLRKLAGPDVTVSDERTLPLSMSDSESGIRLAGAAGGIDLALFYLYYHDRAPNYRLSVSPPSPQLQFTGFHPRVHTLGLTLASELDSFVVRGEFLHTVDRRIDAFDGVSYSSPRVNETTGVLGVDYTRITNWRVGLQTSNAHLSDRVTGGLVPRNRPLITAHGSGNVFRDQIVEFFVSYVPTDGSSLTQLRYIVPVSSQIELLFGADLLFGGARSQFGQFESASRGYVLLKGYLLGT